MGLNNNGSIPVNAEKKLQVKIAIHTTHVRRREGKRRLVAGHVKALRQQQQSWRRVVGGGGRHQLACSSAREAQVPQRKRPPG